MARVILGLGGNLGNRRENLRAALREVQAFCQIQRVSALYETEPVGFANQPRFLNAVCEGCTELRPQDLLASLKHIERALGRTVGPRFGPRVVDVDILFYDDLVLDTPTLTIPHPRLTERAFVLVPLAEIAPTLVHPVSGRTVSQLLGALGKTGDVRLVERGWADDIIRSMA